jgi:hypothetical protein
VGGVKARENKEVEVRSSTARKEAERTKDQKAKDRRTMEWRSEAVE